jgi:protein-tyrosine phosphatase
MSNTYDGPLPGTYWVEPGRLLAGPYPGSPDPAQMNQRLNRLVAAGITLFIDLTHDYEREAYASLLPDGVQHQRLSVEDFSVPSREHMLTILDTLDAALAEGKNVYVHCWGGIGRTGTVIGCYWVRHGMTGAAALQAVEQRRHTHSPETDEQRLMIEHWREEK